MSIISAILAHKDQVLLVLFLLSEILAQIPQVKANSVFQLLFGWLSKSAPKVE